MESLTNSGRNSLSSSIKSLNSGDDEEISGPQPQEGINPKPPNPIPAPRPSLLGKELHQPNQGGNDSGIESPESNEEEPAPVVIPVRDTGIHEKQKDAPLKKQSNNRSFYFALTAISTLGAIACFAIAGFMSAKKTELATLSVVAIGALCLIGIGLAAAAKITWNSIPPSELSPTGLTHPAAKREVVN